MNNFIKENWFKLVILLTVLGLFYWYEYRPTKIKEKCSAEARFDRRADSLIGDEYEKFINSYYDDCLMRFGLK
ncbi:MAG: hypothetical protein WC788_04390 [Candidatus Paceibacterota bacterium]|jgi:hypothetical protein